MSLFPIASPDGALPALDELPWQDQPEIALCAAQRLIGARDLSSGLVMWLADRPPEQLSRILDRSLERTTHFKWFLGDGPAGYTVWLHEYRAPEVFAKAADFAASVHNHRYGFCSRVLSGALHTSSFALDPLRLMGHHRIGTGDTMLLSHEDVHRVDRVEPQTYTIVIQGPPARGYSVCFDLATGVGREVYDLRSRLPGTVALLAAVCREEIARA
jgi:hypothetical protein